ncbi:unannotated protein [freshwater metagenome]|uniref:Unannotated protein n=1 Tax=freshwater metagenome TaxID=449393 RepID=A0A6J7JW00_9ZZZZ
MPVSTSSGTVIPMNTHTTTPRGDVRAGRVRERSQACTVHDADMLRPSATASSTAGITLVPTGMGSGVTSRAPMISQMLTTSMMLLSTRPSTRMRRTPKTTTTTSTATMQARATPKGIFRASARALTPKRSLRLS